MNKRLSNSPSELKDRYAILVIGSGYGGSITAARLAAAGHEVCILERGREWMPGEFPDELSEVITQIRSDINPLGLYDYRVTRDVDVFSASGLGGTSLINASVLFRPDRDVFDHPRWPDEIRTDRNSGKLDEYYEMVSYMLQGAMYPDGEPPPAKMQAHEKSAQGRTGQFSKLNLSVNFDRYDNEPNHVGVHQRRCSLCGDCLTGCNVRAKNTLYMNYLPFARQHGAFIFTEMEADYLSRAEGGGYFVHCTSHGERGQRSTSRVLHAHVVILSAGTLGSTQILIKSRDRGLTVSEQIGHYFSGNGDQLGFGYNNDVRSDILGFGNFRDDRSKINVGPTILSIIDYRNTPEMKDRFIIEEGNLPRAFVDFLRYALPKISEVGGYDTDFSALDELSESGRIIRDLAGYDVMGALNHSMVYLGMGHDDADGVIALDPKGNIRIHWDTAAIKPVLRKISDEMKNLVAALGGTYIRNPRWSPFFGRNITTVHPLGGCAMGRDADAGVVDHLGRVFDPSQEGLKNVHGGLYVADGSIIPTSLGGNPLFTISALSERIAEKLIRDDTVRKKAREGVLPVPSRILPPVGMEFTEEMKGYITKSVTDAKTHEEYLDAGNRGKADSGVLDFKLTIYIDDVNGFVTEASHEARAEGYVAMGSSKYTVDCGRFNLFIEEPQINTRRMIYSLQFTADDGQPCFLKGFKEIRDDPEKDVWELWKDTTTLFTTVYRGKTAEAPVVGQGILRIHLQDFLKQLATFRVRSAPDVKTKERGMTQFMSFFFGSLWETYIKHLLTG